jgi:hypothetical protein
LTEYTNGHNSAGGRECRGQPSFFRDAGVAAGRRKAKTAAQISILYKIDMEKRF